MSTEECENAILKQLASSEDTCIEDSYPWAQKKGFDHEKVTGAVKSLMVDAYVATEPRSQSFYELSGEAQGILANGSQEVIVLKALSEAGSLSIPELQKMVGKDAAKIGMGNAMRQKWIKKDGGNLVPVKSMDEVQDEVQGTLQKLMDGGCAEAAIDDKVRRTALPAFLYPIRRYSSLIAFSDCQRFETPQAHSA